MNEKQLLHRLKKKDITAFDEIVKKYSPYIFTIIFQIIGNTMTYEDAEETVYEVFLSLWNRADHIDTTYDSIKPYLAAAARNAALDKLRTYRHTVELPENYIVISSLDDDILKKELEEAISTAIISLGEPDSTIFFYYYYQCLKINQIAKLLNLSPSAIKMKLARGRTKLKTTLQKEGFRYDIQNFRPT